MYWSFSNHEKNQNGRQNNSLYIPLNSSNDLVPNLCRLALSNVNSPIGCSVAQMRRAHAIYFSKNLSHNISRICKCGTTRLINNFNDIVSIHLYTKRNKI